MIAYLCEVHLWVWETMEKWSCSKYLKRQTRDTACCKVEYSLHLLYINIRELGTRAHAIIKINHVLLRGRLPYRRVSIGV